MHQNDIVDELIKCNRCGAVIEWQFRAKYNKNMPWDVSKRDWHKCPPPPDVAPTVLWYCWDCNRKVNIGGNPCNHFMSLDPSIRSLVLQKARARNRLS